MNEHQYLRLIAESPETHLAAFRETHHVHHLVGLLASLGDLKRLKPEWKRLVAAVIERAEADVARIDPKAVLDAARHFDFSGIVENVQLVESLPDVNLKSADGRFEARLLCDELFDERDQIHLAFWEFRERGITLPKDKWAVVADIDSRLQSNITVRWALSRPRPFKSLYDRDALFFWWWTEHGELQESDFAFVTKWDETLVIRVINFLTERNPRLVTAFFRFLISNMIVCEPEPIAEIRMRFLREQERKLPVPPFSSHRVDSILQRKKNRSEKSVDSSSAHTQERRDTDDTKAIEQELRRAMLDWDQRPPKS